MVVRTFCSYLSSNKIFKNGNFTMDFAVDNPQQMVPAHKCYMEVKYKKLCPPFFGPSIGPIEGALAVA